ncbi:MAG: hypothetical protein Q9160_002604 [Pyrenula sp. 1 TL-2023]
MEVALGQSLIQYNTLHVARGFKDLQFHQNAPRTVLAKWFCIIAATVTSSVHSQDMYDQLGDRARGRWTVPLVIGDTAARCTSTASVTISAPIVNKPFPTSRPFCLPQISIQFHDTGYGFTAPSPYNLQYASLSAPSSSSSIPIDLIFSPTPSLLSATLFSLDSQGLLFAKHSSSSATKQSITVYANALRPFYPFPVFFSPADVAFDPISGRNVLQCEIYAPCGESEQLRCFAVDKNRLFEVSLRAEDYPPGSGEREEVMELSSTPDLPRGEGFPVVGRTCGGS